MSEQRIAERKKFTQALKLDISTIELGKMSCESRGVDVSSHGLGIVSDYPLLEGMVLRISLPVNEMGIALPVFAEVAWVMPGRESLRAGLRCLI
jgi:hypothetical protein